MSEKTNFCSAPALLENLDAVKLLLAYEETDVDHEHEFGLTALHTAAQWGYNEIIEMLVKAGADLEHTPDHYLLADEGIPVLKGAVSWGYADTVQVGSLPPSLLSLQTGTLGA